MPPSFRTAVETLADGQFSSPLRTQAGLHVVAVCGRRAGGAGAEQVSREQIENRLYGQQLTMISRRYMRDLRSSATIETRCTSAPCPRLAATTAWPASWIATR